MYNRSASQSRNLTRNVNPFYIEPNNDEEANNNGGSSYGWEDDEWDDDDDYDEDQDDIGLLHGRQNGMGVPRNMTRARYTKSRNTATTPSSGRMLVLGGLGVFLCMLLLAINSSSSSKKKSTTVSPKSDDDDEFSEVPIKNEHAVDPIAPTVVVLGERHSGVSWLTSRLQDCLDNVTVTSSLFRPAYFFQEEEGVEEGGHHPVVTSTADMVVVVPVLLNVYDWVWLMKDTPQYASNHANLDWKTFVEQEWSLGSKGRPKEDSAFVHHDEKDRPCQMDFRYQDVMPCVDTTQKGDADDATTTPIYELDHVDHSGAPYSSILKLREAKLWHWLDEIPHYRNVVRNIPIRYEDLVVEATVNETSIVPGIVPLLEAIQAVTTTTGLSKKCEIILDNRNNKGLLFAPPPRTSHESFPSDYILYMNQHVEWGPEQSAGYTPWDPNHIPKSLKMFDPDKPSPTDDTETSKPSNDNSDQEEEEAESSVTTHTNGNSGESETQPHETEVEEQEQQEEQTSPEVSNEISEENENDEESAATEETPTATEEEEPAEVEEQEAVEGEEEEGNTVAGETEEEEALKEASVVVDQNNEDATSEEANTSETSGKQTSTEEEEEEAKDTVNTTTANDQDEERQVEGNSTKEKETAQSQDSGGERRRIW